MTMQMTGSRERRAEMMAGMPNQLSMSRYRALAPASRTRRSMGRSSSVDLAVASLRLDAPQQRLSRDLVTFW